MKEFVLTFVTPPKALKGGRRREEVRDVYVGKVNVQMRKFLENRMIEQCEVNRIMDSMGCRGRLIHLQYIDGDILFISRA